MRRYRTSIMTGNTTRLRSCFFNDRRGVDAIDDRPCTYGRRRMVVG